MCSLFFEEDVVAKITLRKNNSLKLLYFTLQDIKQSTIVPVMLFRFAKVILIICLMNDENKNNLSPYNLLFNFT